MKTSSLEILEKSQLPTAQAHAILRVVETEIAAGHEALASKLDLQEVKSVLKSDIAELRSVLKSDMAELRQEFKSDMAELRQEFKSGMAELRQEFKSDMAALRQEFKSDVADLRSDLNKVEGALSRWVLTCMLGQTAMLAGLGYFILEHVKR